MKSKKLSIQNKIVLTVLCLFIIQDQFYAQIPLKIQLYGMSGQLLKQEMLIDSREAQKIDLQDLSDGIYIYKILSETTNIKTNKLILIK